MRLSRKCDYALRALVEMAVRGEDHYISVAELSDDTRIPPRFLEQIVLTLKNAGFLTAKAGPGNSSSSRAESDTDPTAALTKRFLFFDMS